MAGLRSYRELEVWQRAIELVEAVYVVSAGFPKEERFGLTAQMRRAAVSVPSNIAEGHARSSTRDYLRFLSISLGSLAELDTQMLIARRLRFAEEGTIGPLEQESDRLGRMLRNLIRSLKQKLD
jgi:four helix bundle protein